MKKLFSISYDARTWSWFDITWPWIGLATAIIMLCFLFISDIFRNNNQVSKWRDPGFFSWLAIPIYMIHEFEEYGIDFLGNSHAFPNGLCHNLNLGNYPACPIPHAFYLYVNIPLVWIFAVLAAILSAKNSLVGLGLYSVIITNGMVHILTFFLKGEYNPGLFSAIVIFLPSFIWLSRACFGRAGLPKAGIYILIGTGIILHAILISSLIAFVNQKMSGMLLNYIQVFNASTIVLIPWAAGHFLIRNAIHNRR